MYKVMIVDDEPIIRYGIRACLDWPALGLAVVGEYANGEEAYNAMQEERPDILITDIKMPLMDGIELSAKALALIPTLKVVFVSSYNDFEFVREGIRLGAVDYILKPALEPAELEALMLRCIKLLDREREVHRHLSLADRQAREEERRKLEQDMKRHLLEEASPEGLERLPDWLAGPVLSACILLDDTCSFDENDGFMHKTILLEDIRNAWYECLETCIALIAEPGGLFLVMPREGDEKEALDRLERCKDRIQAQFGVSLTAGVFLHREHVPWAERFRQAREAGARRFFAGRGKLHTTGSIDADKKTEAALPPLPPPMPAAPDEMRRLLESRLVLWRSGKHDEAAIKADACSLLALWSRGQTDSTFQLSGMERINQCETLGELVSVLEQLATACAENAQSGLEHGGVSLVEKALLYLHEHYTKDLNLQDVADHVHISKNYFSLLFKKHTGRNFIDYLIQLRIRHARKLLSSGNLRIYEVAEQSGFRDVKYFSKLFRRMTGVSPQEYRANPREVEEP